MAKILVAGASGFVGCNICNWLMLHTNHNIVGIDYMTVFDDLRNLQPIINSKRFKFYMSDAKLSDHMEKIFKIENPNYIINVVSENDLALSYLSLKSASLRYPTEKIINVGSLYSNVVHNIGLNPGTINVVFPKLYGPRQHGNCSIPQIVYKVINNLPYESISNDNLSYEWMYVRDAFDVLCGLLRQGMQDCTYLVSSGFRFSRTEIREKLYAMAGVNYIKPTSVEPDIVPNGYLHTGAIDISKEYQWRPSFDFDSSLEHTMAWYNVNKWAFKELEVNVIK